MICTIGILRIFHLPHNTDHVFTWKRVPLLSSPNARLHFLKYKCFRFIHTTGLEYKHYLTEQKLISHKLTKWFKWALAAYKIQQACAHFQGISGTYLGQDLSVVWIKQLWYVPYDYKWGHPSEINQIET